MYKRQASWLLQKHVPGIKVRVVNVVDLMTLMFPDKHSHGMDAVSYTHLDVYKRQLFDVIAGYEALTAVRRSG